MIFSTHSEVSRRLEVLNLRVRPLAGYAAEARRREILATDREEYPCNSECLLVKILNIRDNYGKRFDSRFFEYRSALRDIEELYSNKQ